MKKLRIGVATAVALAAMIASALPAAAAEAVVLAFQGTASVGCGLFFPGVSIDPSPCDSGTPRHNDGWEFAATSLVALEDGTPVTVTFDAHGDLGAVASSGTVGNLGPWCVLSKGHRGVGTGTSTGTYTNVNLDDVGWFASAGSILPVTGHWEDAAGSGDNGSIIALVAAIGGADCATTGSTDFTVVGVAALT